MIRLYLSLDLVKSEGSPPTGGGPKGASPPKTPGAATGGSGPQVVDCPLGAKCPDGGRHQMGSTKLQEHTAQAQQAGQMGQMPGDESQGKESGKPGVPPGAANIGGAGSDQVKRIPPPVKVGGDTMRVGDEDIKAELDVPGSRPKLDDEGRVVDPTRGTYHPDFSEKEFEQNPHEAKTRAYMQGHVNDAGRKGPPPLPKKEQDPGQMIYTRPGMERKDVPNPMVADEASVPANSKPMDHYKLSQVARDSGDEELAQFHEGMARKRTEGMGSEEHRQLAEQLHSEGMHDQAKYHSDIHSRVGELEGKQKEETPEQGKKHEENMRNVHHEAKTKASKDLDEAKKKHEETKAKADKIKASNEEKIKAYEAAKAEHEKKKSDAKNAKDKASVPKVGKAPQKPKLDKEEKVPEKPDLYEPENDADKLRHESHTSKAKRLADVAESHLKGNQNLSPEQRQRLERAHKMAVYHSNIGYTPTAAHKKELGDVEQAMSGMDVKQHHDEVKAAENQKKTAEASKQAEKDKAAESKQQAKQAKADEKSKAAEAKQQAKMAGEQPQPPQTDLDHARVADHKAQAQKLRENIQSHMQGNPNMSNEEKARAERILSELDKHENMDMVPGSAHQGELKELQKLAGEHGKKPFEAEGGEEGGAAPPTPRHNFGNSGGYVLPMLHSGRALGTGLAASATSPYGAAGHLGPQIVSYGVTGATTAGHRLLHDSQSAAKDEKDIQEGLDQEKEEQAKRAKQASGKGGNVVGRGNT